MEEHQEAVAAPADQQADVELEHAQLEWDSSPEQYQLNISTEDYGQNELAQALEPKVLFPSDVSNESLTSDTASDVFDEPTAHVPSTVVNSRLIRQNAFRRRRPTRRPSTVDTPSSTPRITRSQTSSSPVSRLGSMQRITRSSIGSISAPTTPGQVVPDEVQLLHRVLLLRNPVVPEVVQLGPQVQRLDRALLNHPEISADDIRPRRSSRRDIDYAKYNETGDKD